MSSCRSTKSCQCCQCVFMRCLCHLMMIIHGGSTQNVQRLSDAVLSWALFMQTLNQIRKAGNAIKSEHLLWNGWPVRYLKKQNWFCTLCMEQPCLAARCPFPMCNCDPLFLFEPSPVCCGLPFASFIAQQRWCWLSRSNHDCLVSHLRCATAVASLPTSAVTSHTGHVMP